MAQHSETSIVLVNNPRPQLVPLAAGARFTGIFEATLLLAVWLAFAWPWLSGDYTIPWDGKAHFAPQVQFMAASFERGEWPWWTPNVFAGHPQIADPQSMIFSPPFLLLALLQSAPTPWSIDLVVFLTLYAGGIGILWLTRDLGWHWSGRLVAAIGFAFGAAMAWRLQHFGQVLSLAYLPFAILFLRGAVLNKSVLSGALAGLFAAFIVLGRDQVGLLSVYLLAAYAVVLLCANGALLRTLRGAVLPLGAGAAVAAALVSVPILLTIALAAQSNRPAIEFLDAAAGSLHPALLITGLVPHLFGAAGEMQNYWGPPSFSWIGTGLYIAQNMGLVYIGALPLLLLLIGVVRGILWQPGIRFFTVAWCLVVLYALGWYSPAFQLLYELLPGVSFYRRPADAVFLIGALGAVLAGFVADRLFRKAAAGAEANSRAIAIAAAGLLVILAVAAGMAISYSKLDQATAPLLLAAAWAALAVSVLASALWLAPIRPIVAGLLLVTATAADVVTNNGPNGASALPTETLAMLQPDGRDATIGKLKALTAATQTSVRRDRIEMVGLGYHWPNTPLTHGLHSTLGANPVRLGNYVAATGAGDTVAEGGQRAFPPLFPSYQSELANLLGLRFIATGDPIEMIDKSLAPKAMPLVAQTADARIYENAAALPRVIFATKAQAADFTAIVKTGKWPPVDFETTVLLETVPDAGILRRPGKIAIQSYANTSVELRVTSTDGGWAILNDVWHPWWRGYVDGDPAPIMKANVIFRAIEVPPGEHTVRFTFHPLAGAWTDLTKKPSKEPLSALPSTAPRSVLTQ